MFMKLQTLTADGLPPDSGELGLVDQLAYSFFICFFNMFLTGISELEVPGTSELGNLKFRELGNFRTWELRSLGTSELEVPGTSELGNFGTWELTLGCPVWSLSQFLRKL